MSDGGQSGTTDTAVGMFWIGLVLAGLFWLFWTFQGDMVMDAIRWVRYSELWLISLILGEDSLITWRGEDIPIGEIMEMARDLPPSALTGNFLDLISTAALVHYRWIFAGILGIIAFWVYVKGPESENRHKHGISSLIKKQAVNFPYIAPFIDFDPSITPPRPPGSPVPAEMPLFGEALGPEEWLAYNTIPFVDDKMDENALQRTFTKQLGPRWKGARALAPHKQILLAAFCLKASRKRNESDTLLGRAARCWSHNKGLNLNKDKTLLRDARAILRNKDLAAKTLSFCNQHAWQTTALIRALWHARSEGGVLAPAQFVWLRGHDRALWYPLNNLGRNSYHLEALGAICHYKSEKRALRPIPRAKVEDAVGSIIDYVNSDISRPIPQIDYSGSKKRGIKKMKMA